MSAPRRRVQALVCLTVALLLAGSMAAADRGHYHGQVVDAATKQPIERTTEIGRKGMRGPFYLHSAGAAIAVLLLFTLDEDGTWRLELL